MMASALPIPSAYRASRVPSDPASLNTFLARELRNLETVVDGLLDFLPRTASMAPVNPLPGMIRKAISPWRPVSGQTQDRWVSYDGTAWSYLT